MSVHQQIYENLVIDQTNFYAISQIFIYTNFVSMKMRPQVFFFRSRELETWVRDHINSRLN